MTARLITIPISHFCEKARWGLDRAGVDYREEGHLQILHYRAARRAGGGRTVPVLVAEDGVMKESSEILRFADRGLPESQRLFPAADVVTERWVGRLDDPYGADTRLWAYRLFLASPRISLRYGAIGVSPLQRRLFPLFLPIMGAAVMTRYRISAAAAQAAESRFLEVLDEVASTLTDGRPFLTGDRFTAADLTFAALSSPLALPPEYGSKIARLEEMPRRIQDRLRPLQRHPAVEFAQRIYWTQRRAAAHRTGDLHQEGPRDGGDGGIRTRE